jgi:chromosome segregation ATPase
VTQRGLSLEQAQSALAQLRSAHAKDKTMQTEQMRLLGELEGKIANRDEESARFLKEHNLLKQQVLQLQSAVQEATQDAEDARQDYADLNAGFGALRTDRDALSRQVEALQSSEVTLKDRAASTAIRLKNLEASIAEDKQRYQALTDEYEDSTKTFEAELVHSQTTCDKLQARIDAADAKTAELRHQLQMENANLLDQIASLEATLADKQNVVDSQATTIKNLETDIARFRKELAALKDIEDRLTEKDQARSVLSDEVNEANLYSTSLKAQRDVLESKMRTELAAKAALREEVASLEAQLREARARAAQLEKDKAALRLEMEDLTQLCVKLTKEKKEFQHQHEQLERELEAMRVDQEAADDTIQRYEDIIENLKQKVAGSSPGSPTRGASIAIAREHTLDMSSHSMDEVARLRKEVADLRAEADDLQSQGRSTRTMLEIPGKKQGEEVDVEVLRNVVSKHLENFPPQVCIFLIGVYFTHSFCLQLESAKTIVHLLNLDPKVTASIAEDERIRRQVSRVFVLHSES